MIGEASDYYDKSESRTGPAAKSRALAGRLETRHPGGR